MAESGAKSEAGFARRITMEPDKWQNFFFTKTRLQIVVRQPYNHLSYKRFDIILFNGVWNKEHRSPTWSKIQPREEVSCCWWWRQFNGWQKPRTIISHLSLSLSLSRYLSLKPTLQSLKPRWHAVHTHTHTHTHTRLKSEAHTNKGDQ